MKRIKTWFKKRRARRRLEDNVNVLLEKLNKILDIQERNIEKADRINEMLEH